MIQIYADGRLAYDSRLEDYDLQGLTVTTGINKGGTAAIVMPPGHPAYTSFVSYKTIVEIYRDGVLQFRGRALYPEDDFYNTRTVLCEGELCFFGDAVSRPYLYQTDPAAIFAEVVDVYNGQVEASKRFVVGTVTVTDPNDYIRLESESAESVLDTVKKLLDRCGGYIVFTHNTAGERVANWYESLGYRSGQVIEFGEGLLNFGRTGANTDLATVIIPYGAKDATTGQRVTIESVNDGRDYIEDADAVALRGRISRSATWDDVTVPANLLRKAQQWLDEKRNLVTSLSLTALDLSYIDKTIDSYQVGDLIRVRSAPHGVDEDFLLTERTEDLLHPEASTITLGKDLSTLTGAGVAAEAQSTGALQKTVNDLRSDYQTNLADVMSTTEQQLASLIAQTSESIRLGVSETYSNNEELAAAISASMTVLSDQFHFEFDNIRAAVDANDADARAQFTEIHKYITFENGDIKLGASDSAITLTIQNDKIVFKKNGAQFGWWDGVDFHTGNIVVEVNERAQFGDFAFVPRANGSLSFVKVGG